MYSIQVLSFISLYLYMYLAWLILGNSIIDSLAVVILQDMKAIVYGKISTPYTKGIENISNLSIIR